MTTTQKKNAPGSLQRAEGENNTEGVSAMSDTHATGLDPQALDEWRLATLAVLDHRKAQLAADPKIQEWIVEQTAGDRLWTEDDCLCKAVTKNLPDLPPIPLPAWAAEPERPRGLSYAEVEVNLLGPTVRIGAVQAQLQQCVILDLTERGVYPDDPVVHAVHDAGEHLVRGIEVSKVGDLVSALQRVVETFEEAAR